MIFYQNEQNEGVSRWKIPISFLVNHPSAHLIKKRPKFGRFFFSGVLPSSPPQTSWIEKIHLETQPPLDHLACQVASRKSGRMFIISWKRSQNSVFYIFKLSKISDFLLLSSKNWNCPLLSGQIGHLDQSCCILAGLVCVCNWNVANLVT